MPRVDDATAFLRLALVHGLGPITATRLIEAFGSPGAVFERSMAELTGVDDVGPERARRLCDPALAAAVEEERALCHREGVRIVTQADAGYPAALRHLADPPLALWVRGDLIDRDRLAIAVVGPRKPSAYGHRQARRFALGLARSGACIVSGLARGVDTVAHEAALAAEGRTVAVLGSGFGHFYPEENRDLADRIVAGHGAVISEFPWRTAPSPGTFPRRNRVVAALSLAVLVIEAGNRSGALITARLGGELGRQVLALPGPCDRPEHQGSNQLLRDGATLVTSVEEVIEAVAPLAILAKAGVGTPLAEEKPALATLNERERGVYRLLNDEAKTVDDLVQVSGLPASAVSATLIALELRRLARKTPGGHVIML